MGKLYLVGLGLASDLISLRALNVIRRARKVFIDAYTGIVLNDGLADVIGVKPARLSRADIEDRNAEVLFNELERGDVALLVPGDPLVATTHIALAVEAFKRGHDIEVVPGVSIIPNALTISGLMIYKMGKVVTVTYPSHGLLYEYPYDVIRDNDSRNLHTVLLLDIDVERGVMMTVRDAINILLEIELRRGEKVIRPDRLVVAIAALGSRELMRVCTLRVSEAKSFKYPHGPQTLIITSPKLHYMEEEALRVVNSVYCREL
ncbi:MAG: diphthine synthase [Desulfurococcales archaeon ex4484_204]|nr:MAG: diphthine synthase [Desulfurococcales archaeon ex4484_204]